MKKLTQPKKLTLNRETVCLLEQQNLKGVAGGLTHTACGDSACPRTTCLC
jgi:hypothetical protein